VIKKEANPDEKEITTMKAVKSSVLTLSLLAFAGNASAIDWNGICCDGGFEYRHPTSWEIEQQRVKDELAAARKQLADREREIASLRSGASGSFQSAQADLDRSKARVADLERQLATLQSSSGEKDHLASELAAAQSQIASLQAGAGDKDQLAADLAAAKQRNADLESQLADKSKELASLRGELSAEMSKLKDAQRSLVRGLRPQIEKGEITVDLDNERLLINLASGYLFGSGEDELKPDGADALKQVGVILKDFPEYKVAVEGHTDSQPIRSSLKQKFPTNKELSEARAANAAKALAEGGLSGASTAGYADTKPAAPNTTEAGRAKNRRVDVRVTRG